jgi:hypothetical protein
MSTLRGARSRPNSTRVVEQTTDRWLMIFTGAVALFTLFLVGATVMLYLAGEKQLRLASETGKRQSDEMQKSIAAAIRSATVAESALIATDRAWISIAAEINGPLTFDEEVVSLNVEFTMTNVGKSPATHVELFAELCADIFEARDRAKTTVKTLNVAIFDYGVVLFPSEHNDRNLPIGLVTSNFKENIAEAAKIVIEHGRPADGAPINVARPAIMAFATYRLAGASRRHHTAILFEVRHTDDQHFGWDGSVWETPSEHLRLVQTFMSGQVT